MTDGGLNFPDVDEFVWLVETGDLETPWGRWWSPPGGAHGGLAPCPADADPVAIARRALDDWFTAAAAANVDAEDLWIRASVWRLGRVIDGGLTQSTPAESPDPATYGTFLYRSNIDPDAVEVRTPYQVVRAVDDARYAGLKASAASRE